MPDRTRPYETRPLDRPSRASVVDTRDDHEVGTYAAIVAPLIADALNSELVRRMARESLALLDDKLGDDPDWVAARVRNDGPTCVCGYIAADEDDLDGHIIASIDGSDDPSGSVEHRPAR